MNGGNENIDKLFKDAFSGGQFPMDEAMWTEANAMIKASKPAPSYFGVIGAAVALVAVVGTATFLFTGEKLNAKNHTYTERTASNEAHILAFSYEENEATFSQKIFANNTPKVKNNTNTLNTPNSNINGINQAAKTGSTNNSSTGNSSNSNTPKAPNTVAMASLFATNSSTGSATPTETPVTNSASQLATGQTVSGTQKQKASTYNNQFFNDNNFSFHTPNKEEFIHVTSRTQTELVNEPLSENPRSKNGQSKSKLFVPFTFRLSAGYGFGNAINKSTQEPNGSFNANQFNVELSLEYMLNHRWGIQSGISYFQTTETQKYKGLSIEDNSFLDYQDNSYWNYFDNEVTVVDKTWWLGDWWVYGTYQDTILDSNYVTQIDSNLIQKLDSTQTDVTETQRITQLEIPVLITYNFVHKRWVFQVATGASFGMFLNSQGKMIRFEDDFVTGINSSKDFFNSLQYNYLLSAEAGFAINEHWRITARPQLKENLNSMFNTGSGYSQKYLFYGLNVGMAFNF